jgi:hypothetical protein
MKKYFFIAVILMLSLTQAKAFNNTDTLTRRIAKQTSVDPKFKKNKLIAHRGGICEDVYEEYDPRSIKAAIDSGYWMLEIDVRATKDSVLVLNHYDALKITYGLDKNISEMTYAELQKIKAIKGGYCPMSFEEVLQLMKKNNVKIMVDLKLETTAWYNKKINTMLKKYDMLKDAVFLRNDVIDLYDGGKFGFRMIEMDKIKKMVAEGKDVANKYYLFDNGNKINADAARWCQKNNIWVCPSVNFGHYTLEDPTMGAKRDIEYLLKCGVEAYQIDSDFDAFFH